MTTPFFSYLIVLATAALLDLIWLGFVAKGFYSTHLGYLMAPEPNLKIAALFYVCFALAILVFIVAPARAHGTSLGMVFLYGALFGLAVYGAYDFTNQATIRDWPVIVTVVDLLWGMTVSALTATISYVVIQRLF